MAAQDDQYDVALTPDQKAAVRADACDELNIAVLMYNIGKYDKIDTSFPTLPCKMDGYFHILEKDLTESDRDHITSRGWKIVYTDLLPGTPHIKAERLTSKKLKWDSSEAFNKYDYVITHDGTVRINYDSVQSFIKQHMKGSSILLKAWPYTIKQFPGPRVYQEMNDMLQRRPHLVEMSRDNVTKWMKMLRNHELYDDEPYFETDVFIFNPNCQLYRTFGQQMFEKSKTIQRDQFIAPFMLQENRVPFVELHRSVWKDEVQYERIVGKIRLK